MAIRKVVGQVTIEERNEIQQLFERRNGLNELAKILTADNHELYEKLVKDMGETFLGSLYTIGKFLKILFVALTARSSVSG